MGITVKGPNGITINFPDGTDSDTINKVMTQAAGQQASAAPVSSLESFGRGAVQGVTFGFGDELYAGAKGLGASVSGGSFRDTYNREVEDVRQANRAARQANPIAYIGGEVVGGIALPFGAAGTAARGAAQAGRAVSLASRAAQGAKAGAAYGGLYGLGTASGGDGSLPEQAAQRVTQALPNAITGAAVGAVAPFAIDAASNIVKGVTNPLRAALRPQATAQQKVGEALLRDFGDRENLGQVLPTLDRKLQAARATKPDAMLADLGGQNTRDLLRSATNLPSTAASRLQKTLDRRQSFQWSRIERDVSQTLADGNEFGRVMDQITGQLKRTGAREFDAAYNVPMSTRAFSDVEQFLGARGYMGRIAEKTAESVQGMTGTPLQQMRPYEIMHRMKMELDREIGRLKRGQQDAKANWTLRDLVELKRQFVGLLSSHNPQFRKALTVYGDEASLRTALESGADDFKAMSPGELVSTLRGMTQPEKSMFRMGAARSLFDQIEKGNVMRDRTESLFSSPEIQKKLRALFPDSRRFNELRRRLVLEAKMADTRKAVQGNSTSARQLAQGQEAGQPVRMVSAVGNAMMGRVAPVMDFIGRSVQAFHGMTPAVANDVIETLMSNGAIGTQQQLQRALAKAAREPAYREQLTQRFIRAAAALNAAGQSQ